MTMRKFKCGNCGTDNVKGFWVIESAFSGGEIRCKKCQALHRIASNQPKMIAFGFFILPLVAWLATLPFFSFDEPQKETTLKGLGLVFGVVVYFVLLWLVAARITKPSLDGRSVS
jgi:DNA-directed RNA polymerase subunit RPC12/RpoP